MTCTEVREALDALLDGELSDGDEAELREHLEGCWGCSRELEELRQWHGSLAEALAAEGAHPSPSERRRTADAVIAAVRGRSAAAARWAALLAVALSAGLGAGAVALSRPPREQVDRVVEQIRRRESEDARLRALSAEIEQDLGEARKAVARRRPEDPAAGALVVGSLNIARKMGPDSAAALRKAPEVARVLRRFEHEGGPSEFISITRTTDGSTISLTQMRDARIRLVAPGLRLEVRNMGELLSSHGDLCRRFAITGTDGFLCLGDSSASADWKGRIGLLLRTGTWDERAEWDAFRGGIAGGRPGSVEGLERRLRDREARCRATEQAALTLGSPVNVDAILRQVKGLTRSQLEQTQTRIDTEMRALRLRLQVTEELRDRARRLRAFAEEVTRD